jgi:hypothetical protein
VAAEKEFVFIDESGSPGMAESLPYLVVALHLSEECVHRVRQHMTAFRYHHSVVKELKDQRNAGKLTPQTRRLLEPLADMSDASDIRATCNWLDKQTYKANKGPYLDNAQYFRNYQIRRVLERHRVRSPWSTDLLDVVLDRWSMDEDQRRNLEEYLKGNWNLEPRIAHVTTVDSVYVDPIQIADIYTRVARKIADGSANDEERALASRLMSIREVRGGLY